MANRLVVRNVAMLVIGLARFSMLLQKSIPFAVLIGLLCICLPIVARGQSSAEATQRFDRELQQLHLQTSRAGPTRTCRPMTGRCWIMADI